MLHLPSLPYAQGASTEERQVLKRRMVQNDVDTRKDLPVALNSNLAKEGFTYQTFRVGGPPLQLLPLRNTHLDYSDPVHPILRQLLPRIEAILEKFGVELDDGEETWGFGSSPEIEFVHRTVNDEPPSLQNLTILIPAQWNEHAPFQWLHVVDELRGLLIQDVRIRPIRVELIGGRLLEQQVMDAVKEDHPIIAAWDSVRPQILSIFAQSEHLRDQWWSLGVRRMGCRDCDGVGPFSTVVSILVNWDVNPFHWENPQELIKNVLRGHNLSDVDVIFSRGEICYNAFPLQDPSKGPVPGDILEREYNEPIAMGSDFGPAHYFLTPSGQQVHGPSGTLGGYLKVTDQNTQVVRRMGLTNYRTVRGAIDGFGYKIGPSDDPVSTDVLPGSDLDALDRNGMEPDFARREAMVLESPSRRKHDFTLYYLKNDLVEDIQQCGATDPDVLRLQSRFDQKDLFDEERHLFGRPWAASGYGRRTSANSRLDWALIEFTKPNRLGTNVMPPKHEWPVEPMIRLPGRSLKGVCSCDKAFDRKKVFKKGAGTGLTEGSLNCIKDTVRIRSVDDRLNMGVSYEYVFISRWSPDNAFAVAGDSGAMVFTDFGKLIGLVWGGSTGDLIKDATEIYMTDAGTLLQHLNAHFQGRYGFELLED